MAALSTAAAAAALMAPLEYGCARPCLLVHVLTGDACALPLRVEA